MVRRLADALVASLALALATPILVLAAIGIRASGEGPLFYRARRVGRGGTLFTMYKLRTMRVGPTSSSAVTAHRDPRVFAFGAFLRRTKLDELPQLLNVIRGDMAIVGPRPEDPDIVARFYWPVHHETLRVRPGMTSPGSLYNYTHAESLISADDPERSYVERVLPRKLALDVVYVRNASWRTDLAVMARTFLAVGGTVVGRRRFDDPPEMNDAERILAFESGSSTPQRALT